jgi:hypothetical protein
MHGGSQGRRKQCEAAGAAISKGHLPHNHHFSGRQYLLKIYCSIDTRRKIVIVVGMFVVKHWKKCYENREKVLRKQL